MLLRSWVLLCLLGTLLVLFSNAGRLAVADVTDASPAMHEDFEGPWPTMGWVLDDAGPGDGGEYLWGARNCHPRTGRSAGWAVGGGAQGRLLDCASTYPDHARTWAVYGPFDLSRARGASLSFYLWGRSEGGVGCPADYLFVGSSGDDHAYLGSAFCGRWTAGEAGNGYYRQTLDLSHRLGQAQVWIGFAFVSDNEVSYSGFTVDDIELHIVPDSSITPTPSPTPAPTATAISAAPFRAWLPLASGPGAMTATATATATATRTPTAPPRTIATPTATATSPPTVTPTATPRSGPNYFVGTTDQGQPIEFTVLPDHSAVDWLRISYAIACPTITQFGSYEVHGEIPVTERRFVLEIATGFPDATNSVTGEFDEAFSGAHGAWRIWVITHNPVPRLECSASGVWTASAQP